MVMPFVALAEQAEAQMQQQALSEQMNKQIGTLQRGMGCDYDTDGMGGGQKPNTEPGLLKRQPAAGATPGGMLATQ